MNDIMNSNINQFDVSVEGVKSTATDILRMKM